MKRVDRRKTRRLYRDCVAGSRCGQHRDRRQDAGVPSAACPLPELGDAPRRRRRSRLVEKVPGHQQGWQRDARQWRGAGLLGQFLASLVDGDRMMEIHRRGQLELTLQPDLPRSRRQQVRATYDVGDLLLGIVDDDGELVRKQTVGTFDDEVPGLAGQVLFLPALEAIVKADWLRVDAHSPGSALAARGDAASASARVDALASDAERCLLEILARARARIGYAASYQMVQSDLIPLDALALQLHNSVPFEAV